MVTKTDSRQILFRKANLSLPLRWAKTTDYGCTKLQTRCMTCWYITSFSYQTKIVLNSIPWSNLLIRRLELDVPLVNLNKRCVGIRGRIGKLLHDLSIFNHKLSGFMRYNIKWLCFSQYCLNHPHSLLSSKFSVILEWIP